MNTTELRTQDEAGLAKEIKDLQRAHFNLRMQKACLLYTSPSPRDYAASRMPSSA